MKVRKPTSQGGGGRSILQMRFSTNVNRNSGAEVGGTGCSAGSKRLVGIGNVRATGSRSRSVEVLISSHFRHSSATGAI